MSDLDSPDAIAQRGRDYAAAIEPCATRSEAANLYAHALKTYGPNGLSWKLVNAAILRKWTPSGLKWIKQQAWKRAKEMT